MARTSLGIMVVEYPTHLQNAQAIQSKIAEHDVALDELEGQSVTPAIVASVNVVAGQPVYVDATSGQLKLCSASAFASSSSIGLAAATTMATFAAPVALSSLSLSDWTAAIGAALLTKGARYFLGVTAGTLSLAAPTTPGQSIVSVGIALSTTQLEIAPTPPILL